MIHLADSVYHGRQGHLSPTF